MPEKEFRPTEELETKEGYVRDFLTNRLIRLIPEEQVRQIILMRLVQEKEVKELIRKSSVNGLRYNLFTEYLQLNYYDPERR